MSITTPTNIAFSSSYRVDKIVKVLTGSYNGATQTTLRGGAIYVYSIAHGLPRPVACELIFSTNGGVTWQDGGITKLAFSDSSNVHIFHDYAATAGTVHYKVYCSWIDDYDATNPLITPALYSDRPLQFDSRLNYQKIKEQGVITATTSVIHSLGYAPNAKVFFEAFTNEVWPLNSGGASNLFLYDFANQAQCSLELTSSLATITTDKPGRRMWYRIYYDAD